MEADVAYYIPGWLRTGGGNDETRASFVAAFPDARHVFWDGWPGNGTWSESLRNAESAWRRLGAEIFSMPEGERGKVILVGHSLGARIVARVLAFLARYDMKVKFAVLLGAAIPKDDPDLKVMGRGSVLPILAACNPLDVALKYMYSIAGGEGGVAFGTDGSDCELENVREISVPVSIVGETDIESAWGRLDVIRRLASHHALFYLEALRRAMNGNDLGAAQMLVPQGRVNLNLKVMDAGVCWRVLDEAAGWKLEQNRFTNHCRILNPDKVRVAWGDESVMRQSFSKVKRTAVVKSIAY